MDGGNINVCVGLCTKPENDSTSGYRGMYADTVVDDRRATAAELVAHRDALLELARARGLLNLRVQDDGVLFVTSVHPGYLKVASFTNVASELVGAYVYVITDDTPGVEAGGIRL